MLKPVIKPLLLLAMLSLSGIALAHEDAAGIGGGFVSGLLHPVLGWDHVAAMVAVGLWGAFLGMPAIWVLPVVFPLVMALGGVAGLLGIPLPAVETGIAVSAIVLGLAVAFKVRPPLWVAGVVVAVFAIFHGYAHGTELPEAANAIAYSAGFMIATGLLHMAGIGLGHLVRFTAGKWLVQAVGALIALAGVAFLTGAA